VPVSAAAAILVVWMLVPARERQVAVPQEQQVAESRPAPPPPAAPPATTERRADAPAPREAQHRASPARDRQSRANEALEKDRAAAGAAPVAPRAEVAAKALSAFAPAPAVIVSPDPSVRWRIQPGGGVQRSSDGGVTWQDERTGVTETLAAGASPSPSVCWLVGAGGTVLRSVDGQPWQRLAFPEAAALVAIRAADDRAATVTTADGRVFATTDGGRTWTRPPG
jgi:hypothetical protein